MTIEDTASGRGGGVFATTDNLIVPSGLSNAIIVVLTSVQDSNHANIPIAGVTDATNSYSRRRQDEAVGNCITEIWTAVNPLPGTYNIEADTFGSVGEIAVFAYLVSGVDLNKLATVTGQTGNAQSPTLSLDSIVDQSIMLAVISTEANISGVGTDQTILGPLTDQSFENAAASSKIPKTPLGTDTSQFTTTSGQPYAMSGIFLAPVQLEVRGNLLQMFQ